MGEARSRLRENAGLMGRGRLGVMGELKVDWRDGRQKSRPRNQRG